MVDKAWLFKQGGRPAIYQPAKEFDLLHEEQKYRHVTYNPAKGIDYTWEREWRLHADELILDRNLVTVILPSRDWVRKVLQSHASLFVPVIGLPPNAEAPWHFIALEDLGVPIPED